MSGLFLGDLELGSVDVDAYCARIAYHGPREPTLGVLQALHRLHPAAIPFETLDVWLGLGIDLNPAAVDEKLIRARRGGYCFEHNTLFLRVLRAFGFRADALIARSRWRRPASESVARTHMAVRVELGAEHWLADVGFGACMLTAPLRMERREAQDTGHEAARLSPVAEELRLERWLGARWEPLYDLVLAPQDPVDLLAANWLISTHPASSFRHHLVLSRTREQVRHVLVDARLTTRRPGADVEHRQLDAAQLEETWTMDFGLPMQPAYRAVFDALAARSPSPTSAPAPR